MKAMRLFYSAQGPELVEQQASRPKPGKGEVLVRVFAAGVTPTELLWYPTTHTADGDARKGTVPSHEFSGVIVEVADGKASSLVGQEVYGMNDWYSEGALAEYCVTQPQWFAPKPRQLSHAEAASVPIGALTAWQGLFERADLQSGERVLVHGGAGAVGVYAVQLARRHGCHVTATVSARNLEFVRRLGANRAIDYRKARFEDEARDTDVVFDTVGGETLRRSWSVLKPNGRLVTIAAVGDAERDERAKAAFFIVEPDRVQLLEIGRLLESGDLRPVVDSIVPFRQAAEAFSGTIERQGRGRVVVTVAAAADAAGGNLLL